SDYYKVWKLNVKDAVTIEQEYPFLILSVLEGSGVVEGRPVKKGDHMLVPNGYGQISFLGDMELIASTAKDK
ncbi:MAG: mannose-6-phosphate isomerase, partial [Lachnospiraceae bacterium]|nr:mannose-6-phosphate isomerase [Lachnospiraceae bacterium]